MASTASDDSIFDINPYENNPALTALEAEVLWEYAKLSQNVKNLVAKTRQLSGEPDRALLSKLRVLERKMGLVMTLYKASVWAVINENPPPESLSFDNEDPDITVQ